MASLSMGCDERRTEVRLGLLLNYNELSTEGPDAENSGSVGFCRNPSMLRIPHDLRVERCGARKRFGRNEIFRGEARHRPDLLRMWHHFEDNDDAVDDFEIETPVAIDPPLP